MKIKSMLLRLQSALGQENLSNQMLLYPGANYAVPEQPDEGAANFVISYNGSPNSQTALDFVLWMAHQTRLATQKQVTVHVVYVIDCFNSLHPEVATSLARDDRSMPFSTDTPLTCPDTASFQCGTVNLTPLSAKRSASSATQLAEPQPQSSISLPGLLEQADRVLWQARCLSDEWRGSLEAHLRFGAVATELRQVVQDVNADLLFIGCTSVSHPLVQQLIPCISCPILGIPTELETL